MSLLVSAVALSTAAAADRPGLRETTALDIVLTSTMPTLEQVSRPATRSLSSVRRASRARRVATLRKAPPRRAICAVFRSHCRDAVKVAWCESRLRTDARNGQYLGIFQMGAWERSRFGHGSTPYDQAVAAHKYFVLSGRDWSPWSCKPSR